MVLFALNFNCSTLLYYLYCLDNLNGLSTISARRLFAVTSLVRQFSKNFSDGINRNDVFIVHRLSVLTAFADMDFPTVFSSFLLPINQQSAMRVDIYASISKAISIISTEGAKYRFLYYHTKRLLEVTDSKSRILELTIYDLDSESLDELKSTAAKYREIIEQNTKMQPSDNSTQSKAAKILAAIGMTLPDPALKPGSREVRDWLSSFTENKFPMSESIQNSPPFNCSSTHAAISSPNRDNQEKDEDDSDDDFENLNESRIRGFQFTLFFLEY